MLGGGASGFLSAPVTKGVFACAAASVIITSGISGNAAYGRPGSGGSAIMRRSAFVSPAEIVYAVLRGEGGASSRIEGSMSASSHSYYSSLFSSLGAVPLSVIVSQLAFTSVSELLAGAVLLYSAARHTERIGGTRRFAALCTLAGAASVAAQCCIAALAVSTTQPHSAVAMREVNKSKSLNYIFNCKH